MNTYPYIPPYLNNSLEHISIYSSECKAIKPWHDAKNITSIVKSAEWNAQFTKREKVTAF